MNTQEKTEEAISVLQQFGLREYEARGFVGLVRVERGTAKRISEMTEVPHTRVNDAIRVLESHGLVEVQHSSPRRFRAVSLQEATETLRNRYEDRIKRLQDSLESIEIVEEDDATPAHQLWSMAGRDAIENRAEELIDTATAEIVLVIGDGSLLTDDLVGTLNSVEADIDLLIGALTGPLQERIQTTVPNATTFVAGVEWLLGEEPHEEETTIGRLLLVDRLTVLVSTITPETTRERAIFGEGFGNGLVVIARRLMAQGLVSEFDPVS
jgi:predicted transcriptional regulator